MWNFVEKQFALIEHMSGFVTLSQPLHDAIIGMASRRNLALSLIKIQQHLTVFSQCRFDIFCNLHWRPAPSRHLASRIAETFWPFDREIALAQSSEAQVNTQDCA